jgi:adenylate cyclase class IV
VTLSWPNETSSSKHEASSHASALGVLAVVKKRRTLLSLDATRIHLDNVDGLGDFIEFEVPVTGDDDAAK